MCHGLGVKRLVGTSWYNDLVTRNEQVKGSIPLGGSAGWWGVFAESANRPASRFFWGCNPQTPPGGLCPRTPICGLFAQFRCLSSWVLGLSLGFLLLLC